jgi:GNAT superfamily N-acetyltransferase
MDAATYSVIETMRDGKPVVIRSLQPSDKAEIFEAVERTSAESLHRRFLATKRAFSPSEVAYFVNVDFRNHVALVAEVEEDEGSNIVGGGRYVVVKQETAEVAFIVIDAYQGRGLGTILMRHLVGLAREAGIEEFVAEVLSDNVAMLAVFEGSGLPLATKHEGGVTHVVLSLR